MFLQFEESQAGICLRMHTFKSTKSYSCDGFGTKMDALLPLYVCNDLLIMYVSAIWFTAVDLYKSCKSVRILIY